MLELEVILEFACGSCGHDMGVTLRCAGQGLAAGYNGLASIKVPCPTCHNINQVMFEPASGALRRVCLDACLVPEPSLN
jgi:phage FluMu protein Com